MQPLVSLVASSTLAVHIQLAVRGFVVQFVQDNLIYSLVVCSFAFCSEFKFRVCCFCLFMT